MNKGEFVIHVPKLHRTAEHIITWFQTVNDEPFIDSYQWKALLADTFVTRLEAKLFKMYLKNGRNKQKRSSWIWTVQDKQKKFIKLAKDPIDNLDWTFLRLSRLVSEFHKLIEHLRMTKAPNFSKQEELRVNLLALTQSFLRDQIVPRVG